MREYIFVAITPDGNWVNNTRYEASDMKILNGLGKDGWKVVAMETLLNERGNLLFFYLLERERQA